MENLRRVFIAATHQNDGKTTISLGLIFNLAEKFKKIGFIKPIGQRYLEEEGQKVDEDSILIEKVCEPCGVKCGIKDMSPIAVEKGFTEKYIVNPDKDQISQQIKDAFRRVGEKRDLVIIEGTGHAGVGSVFDHSNAYVAKLLGSKVILISSGGVGRPIDEIILNKALLEKEGVELLGVIINKVIPEKYDKVNKLVREGLKRKGVEVLGVIPYYPFLSAPTISQILEETNYKLLTGKESLANRAEKIIVGAMEPHDALNYVKNHSLVITPGDRDDIIMTLLSFYFTKAKAENVHISGIILTGGMSPHPKIMEIVADSHIPVLLSKDDTYTVASQLHDLTVKLMPQDKEKIDIVVKMVKEFVDVDKIVKEI